MTGPFGRYRSFSYTVCIYTIICIYIQNIYIYLENHKDKIFCPYGFGHFFCPLRVFSKYGHVRLQTLYLQVNLVNSFPELLDLSDLVPTVWVSRLETVFGAVCWHLFTVFFNMMLKKYLVFYGYIQIWWEIWQYLWPDLGARSRLQFAPLWTEIPLLETVGGCPNTVLSKDLNNPSQSKTKIRNWTKKTSVTGKTHNGQKKCPYGFPGIYIRYPLLKKLVARLVMPRAGKKRIAPLGYHELAAIVGISATIMMGMWRTRKCVVSR